jgi:hypothetical protein
MNPDKQRIAIAEACGYTQGIGMHGLEWWTDSEGVHDEPPDYPRDLNAMHEAENNLEGMNKAEFAVQLCRVVGKDWPNGIGGGSFAHVHTTAAQRAEAFLRTIGKWEDEQ